MERCPICQAQLNVGDVCRRCRADLGRVRQIAQTSGRLAGAALCALAGGDSETAVRLLRRAATLRATPDIAWLLSKIDRLETAAARRIDRDPGTESDG